MRLVVKAVNIDEQAIVTKALSQMAEGFNGKVLPHLLEVAMQRAPKASADRNFNPQTSARTSFKPVELREPFEKEAGFDREERDRLRDLRNAAAEGARALSEIVSPSDIKFFKGKAYKSKVTGYQVTEHAGRTPDAIHIARGGVVRGAFRHTAGTLQKSHKIRNARREGNKIIGQVVATADYAAAVHQGFNHKGGQKKGGKVTKIAGRPWLKQSLMNVKDELTSAATYQE